jgi:hypothetical protein
MSSSALGFATVAISKLGSVYIYFLSFLAWAMSIALFANLIVWERTERDQLLMTLAVAQCGGHAPPSIYCGGDYMTSDVAQTGLQVIETSFPTGQKFVAAVLISSAVTITFGAITMVSSSSVIHLPWS